MKLLSNKLIISIIVFFVCQFISMIIIFVPVANKSLQLIFFEAMLLLAFSVIGDICAFFIIRRLEVQLDDEVQMQKIAKLNKFNDEFFEFAFLQQRNIRFFYHDLNNHIITLDILKKQGKEKEIAEYNALIKERYQKIIPAFKTGNYFTDIICQFCYEEYNCRLKVHGNLNDRDLKKMLGFVQLIMPNCQDKEVVIDVDENKTSFLLPYLDDEIKTQADLCGYEVALQC